MNAYDRKGVIGNLWKPNIWQKKLTSDRMIELKTTLFYAMNHEKFEFPEVPNSHK